MKMASRWIPVGAVVSLAVLLLMMVSLGVVHGQATRVRWDMINVDASGNVTAGGQNSALADDGSTLTLTGSGTFEAPAGGEGSSSATAGGGTWQTFDNTGAPTGSGTYQVTGLVRWEQAPGTFFGLGLTDKIGNPADARPGLVVLEIQYSDRSRGVLVFSCSLNQTPAAVFEGSTASKGFVDFWSRAPNNLTVFHILQ